MSVSEILRDPAWASVAAILAIATAIAIYFLQKQRKEVAFGVISAHSLLTVSEELANRVVVLFDSKPVTSIRLVVLGIKNSGDKPILKDDFERPLSIAFGPDARVLSADITKQSPPNLGLAVTAYESSFILTPVLLNPGDYVVMQALVAVPRLEIQEDTRIIGVSELTKLNAGVRLQPGALRDFGRTILILAVGALIFSALYYLTGPTLPPRPPSPPATVRDVMLAFGSLALVFSLVPLGAWVIGRVKNNARRYIDAD